MATDAQVDRAVAGRRPRVVIVGAGLGGLAAARRLRRADVDVTLVDRMNHTLFQPLLYQIAAGMISPSACADTIRERLKGHSNTAVLMAEVVGFDVDRRQVVLDRGERLDYDRLIVACGSETSYFGHDEWRDATYGLKTLADAVDLRDRIFGAFEEAERATDAAVRRQWLTFVVVGGGPTGVEIAGQLGILAGNAMRRDFRRIDPRDARVILVDAGDRVVPAFSERLSAKAGKYLADVGVTVREGATATAIDAEGLTVKVDGAQERIDARTIVWAAGVRAAGLTRTLAQAAGSETDRAGRIAVNPDLTLAGHPEIAAIGDATQLAGPDGKPLPGLATVAVQQAHHVARGIRHGKSTPFRYFDRGALAVIGRGRAICAVRGVEISGPIALLTYFFVHLYYIGSGGGGRRVQVLISWIASSLGSRQSRVIRGALPPGDQASPAAAREAGRTR